MADISTELEIIKSDPYGRNVKQAIYEALVKINNSEESGNVLTACHTLRTINGPVCFVAGVDFNPIE